MKTLNQLLGNIFSVNMFKFDINNPGNDLTPKNSLIMMSRNRPRLINGVPSIKREMFLLVG